MGIHKVVLTSPPDQTSLTPTAGDFRPVWPRVLPFATYMGFIGVSSAVTWFGEWPGNGMDTATVDLWLYPIKTLVVGALLLYFWSRLSELKGPMMTNWGEGLLAGGIGLVVYVLWVRMDWAWAIQGDLTGYHPFQAGATAGVFLAGVRIFGASVVVPIMEELFWRSFLIRYIINSKFETIRLGAYTLPSFLLTVVLFGLEHNLWLAGMMAGVAYNLLLYRTGRLWPCILAHGVTNLALGIHVLATSELHWW